MFINQTQGVVNSDIAKDINLQASSKPLAESISDISWATNQQYNIFATTEWGGDFRVYEIAQQNQQACLKTKLNIETKIPLTACCWTPDNSTVILGFANNAIKAVSMANKQITDVGEVPNGSGICSLHYIQESNVIMTTAYNTNIYFFQPNSGNQPVQIINTGEKLFSCDYQAGLFIGGCANEKIVFYDAKRNFQHRTVLQNCDLGKYSQINSLKVGPNARQCAFGSIDGRVNISEIRDSDGSYTLKTNITFKSNKQDEASNIILYPVNTVDFNRRSQKWILTGGSDGQMAVWDYGAKNKIKSFNFVGNPVCKAKTSPNGDFFAYGIGYDWHIGVEGEKLWKPSLAVHYVPDNQLTYASGAKF